MNKRLYSFMLIGLLCGLQACAVKTTEWLSLKSPDEINAISSDGQYLLAVSEKYGLFAYRDEMPLLIQKGKFELLDTRDHKDDVIAFTLDKERNVPLLVRLQGASVSSSHFFKQPSFQVDALCLYQDTEYNVYAFMLDGYGGGEMRWLLSDSGAVVDLKIKELRLPPGSESCAVDDELGDLYVLEEEFGVWRYSAKAESALERSLVELMQPRGRLDSEPLGLEYSADFGLLVLTNEAIVRIRDNGAIDRLALSHSEEIVDLAIADGRLVLFDEGLARLNSIGNSFSSNQNSTEVAQLPSVKAVVETTPVDRVGDAADDPAIWVHPLDSEKSLILGTNKKWGLLAYTLDGVQVQALPSGHLNNVDVRQNIVSASGSMDIAVASNRSDNTITVFSISNAGDIQELNRISTDLNDVYGICLYSPNPETLYTFINDKDGRYQQWRLIPKPDAVSGELVREFSLASQPEGCVANDSNGDLFVGEEDYGLWLYSADEEADGSGRLLQGISSILHDDVEGLALIKNALGNYLVVSSQGNHSYAVFNAHSPFDHIGSFRIGLNAEKQIDGASETDGLDLSGVSLGENFPGGVLVVQDGFNVLPQEAQNFKLVSWEEVLNTISK
jgi:3-phytase